MINLLKKGNEENRVAVVLITTILLSVFSFVPVLSQALSATEIVRKTDEKFRGENTGYCVMTMTIIRPSWQRTVEFKSWSMGTDFSLTLITAPARDKGQTFLKRKSEMWNWNPVVGRLIKLPPSMMSQGWMGSDYTNDDILKESSVVNDYTHEIEKEEDLDGRTCYKAILKARENSNTLWARQVWWIDKKEFIVLKAELYDEDNYLVRTENASELKVFDGRLLPSVLELIPADAEGNKTIVNIIEMKFNMNLEESFFSQQNMKNLRY